MNRLICLVVPQPNPVLHRTAPLPRNLRDVSEKTKEGLLMRMFGRISLVVFTFVVVLSIASSASAIPVITNGLVGAWEFSGNADDVSGNGNNGMVNGATLTTDRFGYANSAYSFDGVDDVISMPSPISGYAEFTSSAWIKLGSDLLLYENALQVGLGAISYHTTSEVLVLDIYPDRNGGAGNGSSVSTKYTYEPSISGLQANWLHVAFAVDANNTGDIFLNGVIASSVSRQTDGGVVGNYEQTRVGATYDSHTSDTHTYFHGLIDDVYIYNRALSATEVQTLFSAIPEPGLPPSN